MKFKFKLGKGKRERTLFSIMIMMLAATIYFHIFFRPTIVNLSTLLPKVSMLKRDLMDAKSLIARKDIIEEDKRSLQLRIDSYGKIFPSQREVARLLENLSGIAGESDVRIIAIRPSRRDQTAGEEEGQIYQEIPIEIVAKSGYHELGQFLQKLESGERFIIIKDIEVCRDPQDIKRHDVRLTASTYILVKE